MEQVSALIAESFIVASLSIFAFLVGVFFVVEHMWDAKIKAWVLCNVTALVSVAAFLLPGSQPGPWIILLSNAFAVAAIVSCSYATLLVVDAKPHFRYLGAWAVACLAALSYFLFVADNLVGRVVLFSLFVFVVLLYTVIQVLLVYRRWRKPQHLLFAAGAMTLLFGFTWRMFVVMTATGVNPTELRMAGNWLLLAIYLVFLVIWNVSFYSLQIAQYQQQLRDSEQRFRLVVENSPSPIGIWDQTGVLRYVSPAAIQVLGMAPDEVIRRASLIRPVVSQLESAELTAERKAELGIAHLLNPLGWMRIVQDVIHCAQHPGEQMRHELVSTMSEGGPRHLLYIHQGYKRGDSSSEVVTLVHDITEHRRLEQLLQQTNAGLEVQVAARTAELQAAVTALQSTVWQLEQTTAELRRANAGKDALMAAVSHELRTPLTAILSMSELLAAEATGPLTPQQEKYAAAIHKGGLRLAGTVDSILLYTSLVAGKYPLVSDQCHLSQLCAIAIRSIRPAAEQKQQSVAQSVEPPDLVFESDPKAVLQMLKLLLDNAVKFTPEGGRIDVAATPGLGAEGAVVQIVVSDTGIGMSEEQVAALFRPFTQGDMTLARRFDGLGLGLACVHKMVDLLDGSIEVQSTPGAGSCFTITLPCTVSAGSHHQDSI